MMERYSFGLPSRLQRCPLVNEGDKGCKNAAGIFFPAVLISRFGKNCRSSLVRRSFWGRTGRQGRGCG